MFLKQAIISLSLTFFVWANSFSQVNLTQGLVAYYPFSGNANDASGNGINGFVSGVVLTTDAAGNANSAYLFDGTASYITLPFNSLYDFAPTDSFSIATWVQPDQNPVYAIAEALVVKSPYHLDYFQSMWNYGLYLVYNKVMSGWAANNIINGTTTLNNSQCWYHLAVTYKNGMWRLYVNGQLEAQDLTQTHFIIQDGANSTIAIGRKGRASGDYYKGKMDEVRIYNRNLNPQEVKALYDMYDAKPDFSFIQSICDPKRIIFQNETKNATFYNWDFGNNTVNNGTVVNVLAIYSSFNNYNVKLTVTNLSGCKDSITKNIPVTTQFTNGLIKQIDTTICKDSSLKLNVQDSGLAYCWSASNGTVNSGSANITVAPAVNTTYYYNTQVLGANLIVNGDFESGNTGFQTDYTYHPATAGGVQGIYHIANNPNVWLSAFSACSDHTPGAGNDKMMMIDGSIVVNAALWKQTINVQPNTNYIFSGWVQSIVAQNPAQLVFRINGNSVGSTLIANLASCAWKQFSIQWNSGNTSTASLSIVDNNLLAQGNDFAIDDISFSSVTIKTDSVNVDVTNCNASSVCKGVIELHGHDKVTPPTPIKKYFASTGFTWETWFNGSYYVNENTTIDTRSKLISALDLPQCQDIVLGFGWPQVAQKNTLCFVADGPNGCTDRDNTPCTYFPAGGFQPNTWYHVAAVRDYANNTSKLYVNGALVDSKINTHGPINPTLLPGFIFGSWLGVGSTDSGFAGKMDEIRIWDKPRTTAEIQTNYDKCLTGNETGLVAYYHSNEKTGSVLHDVSPNSNNAALSSTITLNKTLNAPITNPCILATTSSVSTTVCQGQSYWGHNTTGTFIDTFVNSLGCDSLRTLNLVVSPIKKDSINYTICQGQTYLGYSVAGIYRDTFHFTNSCDSIRTLNLSLTICTSPIASFTALDTVCVNSSVNIVNTSTGATTYNWNYCSPSLNTSVTGTNLGSLGGNFNSPVFMDYILEAGNYYGFVVSYYGSTITRLDFGNSLLNTPTSTFIGNPNGLLPTPNGAEDIKFIKQNGKWIAFIVGGSPTLSGSLPKLVKLDFGATITNTNPVVTDWGNIGNMEQPHQLHMWQESNIWYGLLFNAGTNTITRINFSNDFNNAPTAVNLGNIGNLNFPSNFIVINDNGVYRVFVTNTKGNSVSRLDFGNSLLNTPTGVNLGNISNILSFPRGIILKSDCDGIYGYLCNQTSNDIIKISMSSYTSSPTGVSLGNIGSLSNPVSFSKEFNIGNDIYCFIPNAESSNTITRIKFQGCTNSSIPNASSQIPPQISYNASGTYNINLTIDDGLATQSVFCKKIVVINSKRDSITHSICQGQTYVGHSVAGIYRDTFHTSNCDSIRTLNLTVLPAVVTTSDTIPASCGSVLYNGNVYSTNTLLTNTIKNYLGCDSVIQNHQIIVKQNIRDTIKVSICNGQSYLGIAVSGIYKIDSVRLSSGCDSITLLKLSVDKYIKDSVNVLVCYGDKYGSHQFTGIYYDTLKSLVSCDTIRAINLSVKPKLNPRLMDDVSICEKDSIVLNPGNFYSYLWNTNATSKTLTAKSVGTYWVQVADSFGCKARDTFNLISINPLPKDFLPNSLSVCDGEQYTLTGYNSYQWMTGETTPTISLTTLPIYSVKVTDINGCSGADSMKVNYVGNLNIQQINAFSPNGDGVNETFKPFSGSCITGYSMKIFDRWGQLLFETTNPNTGWNGKYKGSLLPTAVYYYIINYKNLIGVDNRKAGSITLLR
jgi:gliding motility-associated-like protein